MTVLSTTAIYTALINRVLNYVPTGNNASMPAVSLKSGALGARLWILQAPDNSQFPYGTLRIIGRQSTDGTHGLQEQFTLDIDLWNRPRTLAAMTALEAIGDQVQVALNQYAEPTMPLFISALRVRQTLYAYQAPADRDVIRENLMFDGWMHPTYSAIEVGTS